MTSAGLRRRRALLCVAVTVWIGTALAGCGHLPKLDGASDTAPAPRARVQRAVAPHKPPIAATSLRGTQSTESPAPTLTATNRAQAVELRARALEQMNRGAIDDAVVNLKLAAELDPTNDVIARDLSRALRIQSTVQARR